MYLAMTTNRVNERGDRLFILLRQEKTGALMDLPVHRKLEPLIRERLATEAVLSKGDLGTSRQRIKNLLLVPSPTGLAWHYRNFCRSWDAIAKAAGVTGKQRRDLRRTGVVRLAEAAATVPQIASVTGWGIEYCQRIVDTYLPRRTEVAVGAMQLWENASGTDLKVVSLGLVAKGKR